MFLRNLDVVILKKLKISRINLQTNEPVSTVVASESCLGVGGIRTAGLTWVPNKG